MKTYNLTVGVVLHDLNLASEYCHKLGILKDGALVEWGRPEDVIVYNKIENVYRYSSNCGKEPPIR